MYEYKHFQYSIKTKTSVSTLLPFNWFVAYNKFLHEFNFLQKPELVFRGTIDTDSDTNKLKINISGKSESHKMKFKLHILKKSNNAIVSYNLTNTPSGVTFESGNLTIDETVENVELEATYNTVSGGVQIILEQLVIGTDEVVYTFIDPTEFTMEFFNDDTSILSVSSIEQISWAVTKLTFEYKLDQWKIEYNALTKDMKLITDKHGRYTYNQTFLYSDNDYLYADSLYDSVDKGLFLYNKESSSAKIYIPGFIWLKKDGAEYNFYRTHTEAEKYEENYISIFKKHATYDNYFFYRAYSYREVFNPDITFVAQEGILPLPIVYLDEEFEEVSLDDIVLSSKLENEYSIKEVIFNGKKYLKLRAPQNTFPYLIKMGDA